MLSWKHFPILDKRKFATQKSVEAEVQAGLVLLAAAAGVDEKFP